MKNRIIQKLHMLHENDIYNDKMWWRNYTKKIFTMQICKSVVEVFLIHEMSYSLTIHSTTFLVKTLSVDEFLISDGIVFHITGSRV